MKIPVRTSFCVWLVLSFQRIGIGYTHNHFISPFSRTPNGLHLSLTKAKSTKSVAELIALVIIKYNDTSIHLTRPDSVGLVPASVSQKP